MPEPWKPRLHIEKDIQNELITYLEDRDWFVRATHGNLFSSGWPDLYCFHRKYRQRWIEVKKPVGYILTGAQIDVFHKMSSVGCGIWILTAATEHEYLKLWQPPNWTFFLDVMRPR